MGLRRGSGAYLEDLFLQLTELQGSVAILAVFGVLLLCGLGVPIPEDIPLIAAGYLIHLHETTWVTALAVGLLGVLIGDSIIFWMGKKIGRKLLRSRLVMFFTTAKRINKIRAYYRRYGQKIIFAGRFMPGLRAPIFFVAGSSGVRYSTFVIIDSMAALVSVPIWLFLGSRFGDTIDSLLLKIERGKEISFVVLGALAVAYVVYLVWKARASKRRLAEVSPTDDESLRTSRPPY
jgi:membrane protein DedA with SNARE-associated domain